MTDFYWTFIQDGEVFDADFATKKDALEDAQEDFTQQCEDDGQVALDSREIQLIRFSYDHEEERIVHETIETTVEYERCQSDRDEHSVWHKGGVL